MIRGWKLDSNHQLEIGEDGDFVYLDDDTDEGNAEATAQEIKTRLMLFKGEYFLNQRAGVPYYQEILKKGADLERVKAIVRAVIRSVPSVLDVPVVTISLDRVTRVAQIDWEARLNTGKTVSSAEYGPLVI